MADQLWKKAERDLRVQLGSGPPDLLVWEHSARVARLSEKIAALPELAGKEVDRSALAAAGLYHDAGWVLQAHDGTISVRELLLKPSNDLQREMAADWMLQRLDGIVGPGVLATAVRAVRQCNDRRTDLLEAQILAEAENLDEIGPHAIYMMFRKQVAEGKTMAHTIAVWERQEEYHYWQARIKDGFRFESVRVLARSRLESLRRVINDLRDSIKLEDLAGKSQGSPMPPTATTQGSSTTQPTKRGTDQWTHS